MEERKNSTEAKTLIDREGAESLNKTLVKLISSFIFYSK